MSLYKKIKIIATSSDKPSNSLFYSLWKLESYLYRHSPSEQTQNCLDQFENMPPALLSQINKFEPFNIDEHGAEFEKYEHQHKFAECCFYC